MVMVTDPARKFKSDPGHPEICNVFALHKIFSSDPAAIANIETDCRNAGIGCVQHKKMFAEDLIQAQAPFRERRAEFGRDPALVWDILADGAARARAIAAQTMTEVRKRVGLP
jgi:tryptophanyl-tRNA synthetase